MRKTWDEKLSDVSVKLSELSQKAAAASEDAKAARELKEDAIQDKIGTMKGNVEAAKENLRIAGEQDRSKLSSTLLKAQMTIEAKIQDMRAARDKKDIEKFIEHRIDYIDACYGMAIYLLEEAQLSMLEVLDAALEYEEKYGAEEAE